MTNKCGKSNWTVQNKRNTVKGKAKINTRIGLNNCTKEFPRKSRSPIMFYVFVLEL